MAFLNEPQGVELMEDLSPARWIEDSLWPWKNASGDHEVRVGSLIPEGFAAYARMFHPAKLRGSHEPVRWSTVASWTGRTVHPQMQFERIAKIPEPYQDPPWGSHPRFGSLSSEECRTLAGLLRESTKTSERCYFCVWEGYAFMHRIPYRSAPRVQGPNRAYVLFRGPLDAVMSFIDIFGWGHSPNMWWPADRAWCVATDIDLFDTYIGGSDACIQQILDCPELESLPTNPEARIDLGADTINI